MIMMMTTSRNQPACRRRPCLSVFFLLSLFLAATFVARAQPPPPPPPPPPPAYPGGPPVYHVYWDVRSETFEVLRQRVMEYLLLYTNTYPYFPRGLNLAPVLGPRRASHYDAPPAWIYIHVRWGDAPEEEVTIAMAIDDCYILAFSNAAGVWYKFAGGFQGLPPETIELKTHETYAELISGGRPNMPLVPLGKNSAWLAALQLATFDHRVSPDETQAKDGMSRFVIMMGEGLRLTRIRETFSGANWEKVTFVSADDAQSVVDWGSSSRLVLRWFLTSGTRWGGGVKYGTLAGKVARNSKIFGVLDAFNNRYDVWLRPLETVAELTSY